MNGLRDPELFLGDEVPTTSCYVKHCMDAVATE